MNILKIIILLYCILFLFQYSNAQDINRSLNKSYYLYNDEFIKGSKINNIEEIPNFIKNKMDSLININYSLYKKYLSFNVAYKFNEALKIEDIPLYKIYYLFEFPELVKNNNWDYFVGFSFDSSGNIINQINLPSKEYQTKSIISKEKILQLTENEWKNKKWNTKHASIAYDNINKYFIWILIRKIKGPCRKGRYGKFQIIKLNAYSGEVVSKSEYYSNCL